MSLSTHPRAKTIDISLPLGGPLHDLMLVIHQSASFLLVLFELSRQNLGLDHMNVQGYAPNPMSMQILFEESTPITSGAR